MKSTPEVITAINECLKYERTLEDCFGAYAEYFGRWRISRLRDWNCRQEKKAAKRKKRLIKRINRLDEIPGDDRYKVEPEPINKADDIMTFVDYFETTLGEACKAYEDARIICHRSEDTVSAKLLGRGKEGIEDALWRVEAKAKRIKLIGAAAYIAQHLHAEDEYGH